VRRFPPVRTAVRGEDLIGRLLAYDGRIDDGLRMLQGMYDRGLVESRAVLPTVLGWMAETNIIAGRFTVALDLTREAIERAEEVGEPGGRPWEVGFHALALALLGRLDEAESVAYQVVSRAEADPAVDFDESPAQLALGLVALARAQYAPAAAILRRLDDAKRAAGIREPRLFAHAGELIEALVGAGELAQAAQALSRLASEAERSGSTWSSATAARCEALLRAAEGHLDEAAAAAQRALDLCATLPMPFDRARALFVAGQIHRRRREKKLARQAFEAALAIFAELGAASWMDRSRAELARIPQRQAASGLTATEQAIARLAVEGLTNREIADRAFLSPKTVEVNLTRIYRKLGVRSRAALATRFTADPDEL
jgi:DNA-binding CsgD family transcriptional regulator